MPISLLLKKFGELTEVQRKAVPLIDSGANVLVIAPTGSGKTEAAAIPVLKKIKEQNLQGISAIYITPLRALNRDMLKRLVQWCNEMGITISVRHGDTSQSERAFQARNPPQLLVTTPETLQAILPAKKIGAALSNVRFVIIDEVHELFDSKRGAQLSIGLERLSQRTTFQRIGLSATVADPKMIARFLCGDRPFEVIDLNYSRSMRFGIAYPKPKAEDEVTASKLLIDSAAVARLRFIQDSIKDRKTLIFVNTRSIAEILGSRLMQLEKGVAVHHGSLSKETRVKVEDDFKGGRLSALVSTSSLELGIDIGDISQVIQYMSPRQVARLIQRVGRSGHTTRGTASGTVICSEPDDLLESVAIMGMIHEGILEPQQVCENALDVLAQQIAGLTLEGDLPVETAFELIRKAMPYNSLSREQFDSVINFMHSKRLISFRDNTLGRTMVTRPFYYNHLSTIPSVQKFSVRDASSNSFISTLDEDFVALIDQNDLFITKGVPWRVLDIDRENRTMVVEQSEDISAAIPDWEGEEIPTSFEVAQRVGRLRREIKEGKVPDVEGIEEVSAEIKKFDTSELPDDKNIFIEACADTAVMHIAGGLKANRTLAALIAFYLAEDVGASVRTLVDPYRIVFILPHAADAAKFKGHIARLAHSDIKFELESILPSNPIFKYKFLHAAQAFSFEPRKVTDRLIAALMDTPIFAETMREVLAEYFDASNAKLIIDGISSKEIGLHCRDVKELSALAMRALLRYHGGELIAPIEPTSEIVKAFKRRLLAREVNLLCTYCKHNWQSILGDLPEKIKCGSCGSPMVTVCRREELKLFKKKKRLTSQEMGQRSRLERAAGAIAAGGKRAAIALSAYGVGPSTAAHILSRHYKEEDEFFVALLEAQKNFIKTRRYWEAH